MVQRKLIKFGTNSFVVSIPRDWIEKNKLKKGDSVILDAYQEQLTLTPSALNRETKTREQHINSEGKDIRLIRTEIVSAYLLGYNTLTISGKGIHTYRKEIKQTIINLAGLEIVEVGKNSIIAKDMLGIKEINLKSTLRRVDMTIRMMIDECLGYGQENYDSIFETDTDVNRLVFLICRVLRTGFEDYQMQRVLGLSVLQMVTYWEVATKLEKIGDQAKRISRWLINKRYEKKALSELYTIQNEVASRYANVMKAYYTCDKDLATSLEVRSREVIIMCNAFQKKHTDVNSVQIIENFKSMISAIKHMARSIINAGTKECTSSAHP